MLVSERVLNDATAVSVAEAVAVANETAQQAGINTKERQVTVRQSSASDGMTLWRISYLPITPPGVFSRGGDYIVDVNALDGTVVRSVKGQ